MDKKRIMIVDSHPLLRQGLRQTIERETDLDVCCEAGDYQEVLGMIQAEPPDVLVTDIRSGRASCRERVYVLV